jgi:hypothetical protein
MPVFLALQIPCVCSASDASAPLSGGYHLRFCTSRRHSARPFSLVLHGPFLTLVCILCEASGDRGHGADEAGRASKSRVHRGRLLCLVRGRLPHRMMLLDPIILSESNVLQAVRVVEWQLSSKGLLVVPLAGNVELAQRR